MSRVRSAGAEEPADTLPGERRHVLGRDDAAAGQEPIPRSHAPSSSRAPRGRASCARPRGSRARRRRRLPAPRLRRSGPRTGGGRCRSPPCRRRAVRPRRPWRRDRGRPGRAFPPVREILRGNRRSPLRVGRDRNAAEGTRGLARRRAKRAARAVPRRGRRQSDSGTPSPRIRRGRHASACVGTQVRRRRTSPNGLARPGIPPPSAFRSSSRLAMNPRQRGFRRRIWSQASPRQRGFRHRVRSQASPRQRGFRHPIQSRANPRQRGFHSSFRSDWTDGLRPRLSPLLFHEPRAESPLGLELVVGAAETTNVVDGPPHPAARHRLDVVELHLPGGTAAAAALANERAPATVALPDFRFDLGRDSSIPGAARRELLLLERRESAARGPRGESARTSRPGSGGS